MSLATISAAPLTLLHHPRLPSIHAWLALIRAVEVVAECRRPCRVIMA